jgi:hypothetical protein
VYLDDVSLRSLLASQTGALTDQVTDLLSRADEAEIAGTISASAPILKAEVRSRYQMSNSQGSQTVRKSVVQSLFKEFRELGDVGLVLSPAVEAVSALSLDDVIQRGYGARVDALRRGALVEVEVELVADPIFRFSTIVSEISDMAREFPDMLSFPGAADVMAQAGPINRVLQRLLAGLIPLRARATSIVTVTYEGVRCVVPTDTATALGLASAPLYVVGVTEQVSYWRDVRRVLFSGARFTMLCRVARDGLANDWVPVELADVLAEVAPEFPAALDAVGATSFGKPPDAMIDEIKLQAALAEFVAEVEEHSNAVAPAVFADAREVAQSCAGMSSSATGQNEAFRRVMAKLQAGGVDQISPDEWLDFRRRARATAGLELLQPSVSQAGPGATATDPSVDELLLDTEVIAIYW